MRRNGSDFRLVARKLSFSWAGIECISKVALHCAGPKGTSSGPATASFRNGSFGRTKAIKLTLCEPQ